MGAVAPREIGLHCRAWAPSVAPQLGWTNDLAFFIKRHETVLLAEDEPFVAEFLAAELEQAGFQVISCANGREAIENFQKYSDSVDAVLLDYRMPELSGIEVFDLIHAAAPGIPVVLMSGNIASAAGQGSELHPR